MLTPRVDSNKAKWGKIAKEIVKESSSAARPGNDVDTDVCSIQAMPIGQQISKYAENIAQVI